MIGAKRKQLLICAVEGFDVVVFDLEAQVAAVDAPVYEGVEHERVVGTRGDMQTGFYSLVVDE